MLFHYSTIFVIQILFKKQIKNHIQYLQFFLKNNTNVHVNEILFNPFTSVHPIKVSKKSQNSNGTLPSNYLI